MSAILEDGAAAGPKEMGSATTDAGRLDKDKGWRRPRMDASRSCGMLLRAGSPALLKAEYDKDRLRSGGGILLLRKGTPRWLGRW
jgi:hypothetical protein